MSYKTNRKTKGKFRMPAQIGYETPGTMTGYELCYRKSCGHAASMHGTRGCELDPAGHCSAFVMIPKGYAKSGLSPEDIRAHEEVLAIRSAKARIQHQNLRESADIQWLDQNRQDLQLITSPEEVEQTLRDEGFGDEVDDWGGLFVKAVEGEITEIWGFSGTVPDYGKTAVRLK